ncbi:hypothetical protein [Actinokineospora pegani]|uniref:hypothetical protein n=1 Tax=Actinokineospora pegani TaxID=2654637 RepID=UPI0012E9EF5F|nr:hypothetical protein [Actinokineospora pegani]
METTATKDGATRQRLPEQVERRLRRVAVARWLLPGLPVGAVLALATYKNLGEDGHLATWAISLVPVVWMVRFIRHRLNPQVWPGSAAWGGVLVTYIGGPQALQLFAPANTGYFVATLLVGPVALGGSLWAIAKAMSSHVLNADPAALIDAPFPLTYRAAGDHRLKLTVTTTEISFKRRHLVNNQSNTFPNASMPLRAVQVLRVGPVEEERHELFAGSDKWPIRVRPGMALRIGFGRAPGRDWIFRTDQGEQIARLIQGRMAARRAESRGARQHGGESVRP